VLCDTHDTSILIVDTYATILVSPMSRYTAVNGHPIDNGKATAETGEF